MKPKKIILLLPSLHAGGMERVMAELANYFAENKDLRVHLILYGKKPELFYSVNNNIRLHVRKSSKADKSNILNFIEIFRYIRRTVRKISPDAILSFGTQWNNLVLLALSGLKYKVFISDRGSPERKYQFPQEHLKTFLYPLAAGIIAQTKIAEEMLRRRFPKQKIQTIDNPIRQIEGFRRKENFILSVGRLINSKHHERLIKIFSQVAAPEWKLVIVGGNALKQSNFKKLQKSIHKLGLDKRVMLEGEKTNVEDYYLRSKIFAFTSSVEGFPNVIGEALSSGLPVVSYDCIAGPSEMIKNGYNGYLISVFDDKAFTKHLQILIDQEDLRKQMSLNSKQINRRFSVESIGDNYLNFLLS